MDTSIPENKLQCSVCKNLIFNTDLKPICKAFKFGIPSDILKGTFDHIKKYPKQDNNILFEPIEKG